jgi:DNA-binding NarL/FixJ family response regulator
MLSAKWLARLDDQGDACPCREHRWHRALGSLEGKEVDKLMRISIVSAEAAFREEIRALLEGTEGITAIEEQTGPQMMDLIPDFQPDLILLDLDAGTSYPFDIVSTISRQHPDIKILVLSTPGQERRVLNALRHGAHGHLTKGATDRDQFIAALQAVGRGDSILSPAIAGVILDEMSHRYQLSRRARTAAAAQARSLGPAPAQQMTE